MHGGAATSMTRYRDVCILLPVLNEAGNIEKLICGIRASLPTYDYVICLVDDGSTDGTVESIRTAMCEPNSRLHLIERRKRLLGSERGSALFAAMSWALRETDCRVFVEMDGDLSHRPEELPLGLSLIDSGTADVAIASKFMPESVVTNRTFGRNLVSSVCAFAVRILISSKIKDYSNGYRFYTREAARRVAETRIVYANPIYLSEVMAIWIANGMRIVEFPTRYVGRGEGLSKLRWIDLVKASIAIFEIAVRLRFGRFERIQMSLTDTPGQAQVSPLRSAGFASED